MKPLRMSGVEVIGDSTGDRSDHDKREPEGRKQ